MSDTVMRPGASYTPGMSFREYRLFGREAEETVINASLLKPETAAEMKPIVYPDPDKEDISEAAPHFILGDAFHKAVLEPRAFEELEENFVECPTAGLDTKKAMAVRAANPGKIVATPAIIEKAKAMREAVMRHRLARRLLEQCDSFELTGLCPEPDCGVIRKIRIDACNGAATKAHSRDFLGDAIIDLKSVRRSQFRPRKFRWEALDRAYHLQGAYYLDTDALIRNGQARSAYILIAVTNEAPFQCFVYRMSYGGETIGRGRELYIHRMTMLMEAISRNEWLAYEHQEEPYDIEF